MACGRAVSSRHRFTITINYQHAALVNCAASINKSVRNVLYGLQIDMGSCPDGKHKKMEKYILRKAFDTVEDPYLPEEVLWRQKEQFSDGVGYDWVDGLRDYAEAVCPLLPCSMKQIFISMLPLNYPYSSSINSSRHSIQIQWSGLLQQLHLRLISLGCSMNTKRHLFYYTWPKFHRIAYLSPPCSSFLHVCTKHQVNELRGLT